MRRLFWFAMGATLGALIFRKLTAVAQNLTPRGMAAGVGAGLSDLAYSIRDFADDVRDAMSSQETVLREAAGLDVAGPETARQ